MAERQTQGTQNPPVAIPCEFESHLGHHANEWGSSNGALTYECRNSRECESVAQARAFAASSRRRSPSGCGCRGQTLRISPRAPCERTGLQQWGSFIVMKAWMLHHLCYHSRVAGFPARKAGPAGPHLSAPLGSCLVVQPNACTCMFYAALALKLSTRMPHGSGFICTSARRRYRHS